MMMRRVVQVLGWSMVALAGCKSLPPPTPLAQLNAQQMQGYAVYRAQCGSCHYDRRNGGLRGPSLAGIFKQEYLPSGAPANDERVTATILRGRNTMPAFAGKLDAGELEDLLGYLHTL